MTVIQLVEAILAEEWSTTRAGRDEDVPDLIRNGGSVLLCGPNRDISRGRIRNMDVLQVVDGGTQSWEPAGVGWSEESPTARIDVIISTGHSRERFDGDAGFESGEVTSLSEYDPDDFGGLVGETRQSIMERRKTTPGWDLVDPFDWNDNSKNYGSNFWRGVMSVRMRSFAKQI